MNKLVCTLLALALCTAAMAAKEQRPWSLKMADSEVKRNVVPCIIDSKDGKPRWTYTNGLEALAVLDAAEAYNEAGLKAWAMKYADKMANPDGSILTYKPEEYNLDLVCPGRILFRAWEATGEERYRKALALVRGQLIAHPRTSEGGFWHKKVYPWQMWLDGLYMGAPFYAEYVSKFLPDADRVALYEDIVRQFVLVGKHTYDPATKLYRHGWDESRTQKWADPVTGQSAEVWGRALGWYAMAIVEVLDYLPDYVEGRGQLIDILQGIYAELPKYADSSTGMWYQVLTKPKEKGNYQEATCSAMLVYAMLKGVRKGYLDAGMRNYARDSYLRLVKKFIREENDGTISLVHCCAVAGLGGKAERSGTFEYYISEPVIDNDPKGVGPFIWASLEFEGKF